MNCHMIHAYVVVTHCLNTTNLDACIVLLLFTLNPHPILIYPQYRLAILIEMLVLQA